MRKILLFTRYGITVLSEVCQRARLVAFGASLVVTFSCSGDATAQTYAERIAPTASFSDKQTPVTGQPAAARRGATVDASHSLLTDSTRTEQASFLSGGGLGSPANSFYSPPNVCDAGCDVSWYASYEALYLRREGDDRFSLSRNTFIPDFEYEYGGRYTVGALSDCVNGWEAVYAGPFDWQRQAVATGAGNLQSRFLPSGGNTLADLTTFNNADQHAQAWRAQMNSFEVNRRWWTWDVLSTLIGVRYVDYEEDYIFTSSRTGVGNGLFAQSVDNQMIGAQVGADIMYPVSLRANVGFRGKAGVYANFDEATTLLQNAGTTVLLAGDSSTDVAGLIEMGIFTNYQIVRSVRLTAGYEFWYMPGVATVPEQVPHHVHPGAGTSVLNESDLFIHGGSVGLQVIF